MQGVPCGLLGAYLIGSIPFDGKYVVGWNLGVGQVLWPVLGLAEGVRMLDALTILTEPLTDLRWEFEIGTVKDCSGGLHSEVNGSMCII